jgi:hypothetical protein
MISAVGLVDQLHDIADLYAERTPHRLIAPS